METGQFNQQPIVLRDHDDWAMSVAFGNNDDYLYVGYRDKTLRKWPTQIESMADIICDNVSRNMTLEEWNKFVAKDIDYQNTCPGITSQNK